MTTHVMGADDFSSDFLEKHSEVKKTLSLEEIASYEGAFGKLHGTQKYFYEKFGNRYFLLDGSQIFSMHKGKDSSVALHTKMCRANLTKIKEYGDSSDFYDAFAADNICGFFIVSKESGSVLYLDISDPSSPSVSKEKAKSVFDLVRTKV